MYRGKGVTCLLLAYGVYGMGQLEHNLWYQVISLVQVGPKHTLVQAKGTELSLLFFCITYIGFASWVCVKFFILAPYNNYIYSTIDGYLAIAFCVRNLPWCTYIGHGRNNVQSSVCLYWQFMKKFDTVEICLILLFH